MTTYTTEFSCVLQLKSADQVTAAQTIYAELDAEKENEGETVGFDLHGDPADPGAQLSITDSDGEGNPDNVVLFVERCAEAFGLSGLWGFQWSYGCSAPRLDGFGGGAVIYDLARRQEVERIDSFDWLAQRLAAHTAATVREIAPV